MSFLPIIVHVQQLDQKEAQVDGIRMLHTVGENWLRSLEFVLLGDVSIFEQSAASARRVSECPQNGEVNKKSI